VGLVVLFLQRIAGRKQELGEFGRGTAGQQVVGFSDLWKPFGTSWSGERGMDGGGKVRRKENRLDDRQFNVE